MMPTISRTSTSALSALTLVALLGVCPVAQRKPSTQTTANVRVPDNVLLRIIRAEDERNWDASELGALFTDKSTAVRTRALLAAGRIGDETSVASISSVLRSDREDTVRAMAAFALGEIEAASGAEVLLETVRLAKSSEVRGRSVEALGKIAAALPEAQAERKRQLGEAVLAALDAEQKAATPDRAVVLLGITAALRSRPANAPRSVAAFLSSSDARVRADAANALARLRAKEALPRLREMVAKDSDAIARANAARVLGAAEDTAALDPLIARAIGDPDGRVRVSANRSLALLKDARAVDPLIKRGTELAENSRAAKSSGAIPSEQNELLEIATTLGRLLTNSSHARALELLKRLRDVGAPEVEIALARLAPAQFVRELAAMSATTRSRRTWQANSAFGQGLGEIAGLTEAQGGGGSSAGEAQTLLRAMLDDPAVQALAVPDLLRGLAAFKPTDLANVMRTRLKDDDVIVRSTAAEILAEMPADAESSRALVGALPRALRDEMNDAALSILGALSKQQGAEATQAIRSGLEVTDYIVRRRAAELLRPAEGTAPTPRRVETVATRNREADYKRAISRIGKSVRAVVQTDKGAFSFEFIPEAAPLNVDNFIELARKGFFNGIAFHRVVPNFVVQGGDPRGDGNGGPGYQIRCEINLAPYERGAVGMALAGKDTGGSQWFVTHSPQPHLDGGYTVFGNVVEGMDVIDRLARGDRIRSITITESKGGGPTEREGMSRKAEARP